MYRIHHNPSVLLPVSTLQHTFLEIKPPANSIYTIRHYFLTPPCNNEFSNSRPSADNTTISSHPWCTLFAFLSK